MSDLNKIWSHSDCLSQEQLANYLENNLDTEQTHLVESHLTDCLFCSDALEGLQMLPADEAGQQIGEIEAGIESLLFNTVEEEEKVVPISKKVSAKPVAKELTSTRGGKSISWRAAAGLFLLIFGGGLVVFSYVNNNTDWLKSGNQQLAKTEKSSKKEFDVETKKSSGKELETLSAHPDEFEENESAHADESNNKKNKNFEKAPTAVPKEERLVARADKVVQPASRTTTAPAAPKSLPQSTASSTKIVKRDEEKEVVATLDRAADKSVSAEDLAAGSQNTYTSPEYKGKMKNKKDMNQEPVVATSEVRKKTSKYKESKKLSEIDVVQREGLGNQSGYNIDNYSQGYYAFNKADYKTSIKFFKKALKEKNLKNRDETTYYLALAYEKTNATNKAQKLYTSLLSSKNYKGKAQQRLSRIKANTK